ncbi:MAG: hypothetical protein ACYTFV_03745 [Planctomycetota bacterium]|jgi:hypothetical protein
MGLRDTLNKNQGKPGSDDQEYLDHLLNGKYMVELQRVVDGEYGDHKGSKAGISFVILEMRVIKVLRKDSGDAHWSNQEPWESQPAGSLAKLFLELEENAKGFTLRGKKTLMRLKRVAAATMASDLGEVVAPQDLDDDQVADWAESKEDYAGVRIILDLSDGKNFTEIKAMAVSGDEARATEG